jgi:hypothetical protein
MISGMSNDPGVLAQTSRSVSIMAQPTLEQKNLLYLRQMLQASGLEVGEDPSATMLAGVYDHRDPQRHQADSGFLGRDCVRVACQPGASTELALDLGIEMVVALVSLEASAPLSVCMTVPSRVRSFTPVLVAHTYQASKVHLLPLARRFQGFRVAASGRLPSEQDVLERGGIAIAVAHPSSEVPAAPRWVASLMHLLERRWTGSTCACCP